MKNIIISILLLSSIVLTSTSCVSAKACCEYTDPEGFPQTFEEAEKWIESQFKDDI